MVSMRAMVVIERAPSSPHLSSRASSEAARPGTHADSAASSLPLRRTLQAAFELLRGEVAALVVVADRIGRQLRLACACGVHVGFGIAARLVAVAVGDAVVPPAAGVAADAVDYLIADVGV